MPRLLLLALLALGLSATASAQTDTPDDVVSDTTDVEIEEAVEPDPERARAIYGEGLDLFRADNMEEALLKYEESLLYNETYAPAAIGRAQVLARMGRLEDSRNAFEAAVAMAAASDAGNAAEIQAAARRGLDQVTTALEARAAAEAARAEANAANETTAKVTQAVEILNANELTFEQAAEGYALLEQARVAGYDADQVALYYAKALVAMDRGADAVPYAETALAATEGEADRSGSYIQLGLAHMNAGNAAEARAAFEAVQEGQAWHGWAQHYLGQVAEMEAGG